MTDKHKALSPEEESLIAGQVSAKLLAKHTVAAGDSLSKIAEQHYGDSSKWQAIYVANKDIIGDDPNQIEVGQVLKVPELD